MINGLIGPDLYRALCQNYVMRWNDKFLKKCKDITENSEDINIVPKLLQTFVDDSKNVVNELPPGAQYQQHENKIIIDEELSLIHI